jgi:hypothetical protein
VPDLDIITMSRCTSLDGRYAIKGSKGAIYIVNIGEDAGPAGAHCTCPSFRFHGADGDYCKHIDKVLSTGCRWNELIDGGRAEDGCCPECGHEVAYFKAGV